MTDVQYRTMMSSSDALIWDIERDPTLRSTVMAVWILDSEPDPDRMSASIQRMVDEIPRLRQRVASGRPRPSWVEFDDLHVSDHYVHLALPYAGGGLDEVLEIAGRWMTEPFDRTRPLWRIGMVTGLADGRAAVIIRAHHSIADGMGMVLMLGAFTDLEADPAPRSDATPASPVPVAPTAQERPAWSVPRRMVNKVGRAGHHFAKAPVRASSEAYEAIGSAFRLITPNRTPLSALMTDRSDHRMLAARILPLSDLEAVAARGDCSVDDVFVTIVADAIARYHAAHAESCDRLRVHVPVNSRTVRTAALAGNEFVPARVALDTSRGLPVGARLHDVSEQLVALRAEPALGHVKTVAEFVERLGRPLSRWVIGGMMRGVDVLVSNLPGPRSPLYIAGSRIDRFVAFGPPAGAALNLTLFTYDGNAHLGVTIDTAAVTDRRLFVACLDDALEATVAHGRVAEVATVA